MRKLSISFASYETLKRGKDSSNCFGILRIPDRSISIVTPHGAIVLTWLNVPGAGSWWLTWGSRTRRTVIHFVWEYPTESLEPLETMSTIYHSSQTNSETSQSNVSTGEEPL